MIPEVRAKIKHIQLRSISEGYKKTKVWVIPDVWHCYQIHECLSICNHERSPLVKMCAKLFQGRIRIMVLHRHKDTLLHTNQRDQQY